MTSKYRFPWAGVLLTFLSLSAHAALPTAVGGKPVTSLAPLVEAASPAVVSIRVTQERRSPFGMPAEATGGGSGVIVDAENGYILTNHHVVAEADEIQVGLIDGRTLDAEIMGSDAATDIAVIKVDAKGLTEMPIGDSERVRVGDFVLAIGPIPMMRAVADVTRPHGIKTVVSLNPIMVDGTGMCGACRVTVGSNTRFAFVEGPEFDGHQVDFDELITRLAYYQPEERAAAERLLADAIEVPTDPFGLPDHRRRRRSSAAPRSPAPPARRAGAAAMNGSRPAQSATPPGPPPVAVEDATWGSVKNMYK